MRVALVLVAACGRIGFDPAPDAASEHYLKASNVRANDLFGSRVAISADGSTIAVGTTHEASAATGIDGNESDTSAPNAGAVYVFARSGATWTQQAYVKASNTQTNDGFGASVALSADGNTLAVGAPAESSGAAGVNGNQQDNSVSASGAAYVFTRAGDVWSQEAYVKASNPGPDDEFGTSLALSGDGNTLAVTAFLENSAATGVNGNQQDESASDSGAAYVFTRGGTAWSQQAYVKASNTQRTDELGISIALSSDGNTLAVCADSESSGASGVNGNQADDSVTFSGAAYVFTRTADVWTQQAYIKSSNPEPFDFFSNLMLSGDGNTLAVAATGEDSAATGIDGDQSDNSATSSGAVYVFGRTEATWAQQAYVKASNAEASDFFTQVALSDDGSTLVVGASGEAGASIGVDGDQADNSAGNSGAVYVFVRSGATWSQTHYLKASNTGAGDGFGASVAISGNGETIVAGSPNEASASRGVDGDGADNSAPASGAVYVVQ